MLDRLWPSVAPASLVRDLLGSQEGLEGAATGLLTEAEQRLVVRPKGGRSKSGWTTHEIPLLDEAESLINGRARSYGHIVVDEAQDLSPMQFRMVARRAPSGSLTILGDLAQATGAWSYDRWEEILAHLPEAAPVRTDELTLGYRAPGQVLELASRLLPVAAPAVTPTRSIRPGRDSPRLHQVPADGLISESLAEATRLAGRASWWGWWWRRPAGRGHGRGGWSCRHRAAGPGRDRQTDHPGRRAGGEGAGVRCRGGGGAVGHRRR